MLHWACDRDNMEIVTELLNHHADLNIRDNEDMSALDYATICENDEIIDLLVDVRKRFDVE